MRYQLSSVIESNTQVLRRWTGFLEAIYSTCSTIGTKVVSMSTKVLEHGCSLKGLRMEKNDKSIAINLVWTCLDFKLSQAEEIPSCIQNEFSVQKIQRKARQRLQKIM